MERGKYRERAMDTREITIRNASMSDMEDIMRIYEQARIFMAQNGNPNQWKTTYPQNYIVENDINSQTLYVAEYEKRIVAVFYFDITRDETYEVIKEGNWLNDDVCGVIHRVASDKTVKGIFKECLEYCKGKIGNIKIDTHKDNKVMQHVLEKNGFKRCGIVYVENNEERIAYQYTGCN